MPNYFLPIQNGDGDAILVKEDTRKRLFSLNFPIYFFQFREIRIGSGSMSEWIMTRVDTVKWIFAILRHGDIRLHKDTDTIVKIK